MAGVQNNTNSMEQLQISRQCKVHGSDITWSGEASNCSEQLKHYPAFCRDKRTVAVYSFVLILGDEQKKYLGYLEDLYEDKQGEKMVQVRWFYHNQEVKNVIPELDARPNEVFFTPHVQGISAKCVDSIAAVLTPSHYEKCSGLFPEKLSSGIFICHRELKCRSITHFSLSKLRGYDTQELLRCNLLSLLEQHGDSSSDAQVHQPIEEKKDIHSEDLAKLCCRRTRSRRKYSKPERFIAAATTSSNPENHINASKPPINIVKTRLPSLPEASNELDGSEPSPISSKFDQGKIELLCQDSGMRGCWFKCKILRTTKSNIRVQYNDIQNVEGTGKLEEWISASRLAAPDKFGMRCAGRLTIRPWPSHIILDCSFEVGDAVDAWLGDGWWEGVVIGLDNSESDNLEVYFPGENKFSVVQRDDLRPSSDWIDQKWVPVMAKRDILSFISSIRPSAEVPNHQSSSSLAAESSIRPSAEVPNHQCSSSLAAESNTVPTRSKPVAPGIQKLPSSSAASAEPTTTLSLKKRLRSYNSDNPSGNVKHTPYNLRNLQKYKNSTVDN